MMYERKQMTMMSAQLVDRLGAAAYLGVSARMVEKLAGKGLLPKVRIGRAVRYHIADLDAFIERQKSCPVLAPDSST